MESALESPWPSFGQNKYTITSRSNVRIAQIPRRKPLGDFLVGLLPVRVGWAIGLMLGGITVKAGSCKKIVCFSAISLGVNIGSPSLRFGRERTCRKCHTEHQSGNMAETMQDGCLIGLAWFSLTERLDY
jgi:hypothetical protein